MPDSLRRSPPGPPFTVAGTLAHGSTASVLLALGAGGSAVALKRAHAHLLGDRATRSGFRSEARWLGAVRSPHLVRVVALVDEPGELCLALDYLHGPSLAALLESAARAGAPLAAPALHSVALDLLAALEAVHAAGERGRRLVHGDVNPRNLVIGVGGVSVLCDLGLAGPEGAPAARGARGTLAYAAPEVIEGTPLDPRADLFSAGVVLWEAIRLERLFRGAHDADTLRRVVETDAPRAAPDRPGLERLSLLVEALLQKDPRARPPSAAAARGMLEAAGAEGRAELGAAVERAAGARLREREGWLVRMRKG